MKGRAQVEKTTKAKTRRWLFNIAGVLGLLLLLRAPVTVNAQFSYTTNNGVITITDYTGSGGSVVLPAIINGLPVTSIGDGGFYGCTVLTSLTIPNTVAKIGNSAFSGCSSLTAVYFQGNAPVADTTVFAGDNNVTVYHLPLATGWGSWFGGRPTALYGQAVDAFNPGADGTVLAMAVQTDGKILVGGAFTTLAGQPRNHLGRLNPDGTLDAAFDPNADGDVVALSVQEDGKILVGGSFGQLGGTARQHLGRLNADGTLDAAFTADTDGNVSALALDRAGRIVAAGSFSRLNRQARSYLARLGTDGTLDPAFAPEPDGVVSALAVQPDGKILVGGSFTNLSGRTCPWLGRLNADGKLDVDFVGGADGPLNLLCLQADGKIYAAGSFSRLSGVECGGLGRLNPDGSLDAVNPGIDLPVQSLAIQANGNILWGSPYQVARLDGLFRLDPGFALATDGGATCVALQSDGGILVGGDFQSIAGQQRNRLARVFDQNLPVQELTYDGVNITWQRFGSSPMVSRTVFDVCTNGTDWVRLGAGAHIPNGEQLAALALPEHVLIRARGFVQGGVHNGSGWFVEASAEVATLLSEFSYRTNNRTITLTRYIGSETAVYIPSTIDGWPVTAIGDRAFENCGSVVGVMLPRGILDFGYGAFANCPNLKSVTMPGTVTNIGEIAFALCPNLTSIAIPESVLSIGREAFDECPKLTAIVVAAGNPSYSSLDGVLFNKDQTTLIRYPGGKTGSFIVPGSVLELEEFAFNDCYNLTSVTLPKSVTSIGYAAFRGCSSLEAIVVDGLNPAYSSMGGVLFNKDQTTLIQYPGGKSGGYAIPGGVTAVGDEAFWHCAGLSQVTFPESLTAIGNRCFVGCTNLNSLTIPDNVTSLAGNAFSSCSSLTNITIGHGISTIAYATFSGCSSLTSVSIPESVTLIGDAAFSACSSLTRVTIAGSVSSLGFVAFDNCTNLTAVYFQGDTPTCLWPFRGDDKAVVYYLPGTTGWGASFDGHPAVQVGQPTVQPTLSIGVVQSIAGPPGAKAFRFSAGNLVAGQSYQLQSSANVTNWTSAQTFLAPQTIWVLTNAMNTTHTFFRLRMVQ